MKKIFSTRTTAPKAVYAAKSALDFAAVHPVSDTLQRYETTPEGLPETFVAARRLKYGSNKIEHGKSKTRWELLRNAFINPFTVILICLALISAVTDIIFPMFSLFGNTPADTNPVTVLIIVIMVVISGILRYVQESRSDNAVGKLLDMISATCTVLRPQQPRREIPMDTVVVGDILHLSTGDMVPADCRIVTGKDFFVSEAALTGESDTVEKVAAVNPFQERMTAYTNIAFMGSNVVSGQATALVIGTGSRTLFGALAANLTQAPVETNFTKGVNGVTRVLIRFMLLMTPVVFVLNGLTKGDWLQSLLFGISIAVGLTPEMLPMIVTAALAKGALSMSKEKTIVKNLNAIQNLGAIDILCTDKTGTLTQNKVALEYHLNVSGREDPRVLHYAYLNSYFQTGYKNLMDIAIIEKAAEEIDASTLQERTTHYEKVDEIPFDFKRRRLSVVVRDRHGRRQMITKGAVDEMTAICTTVETPQGIRPLSDKEIAAITAVTAGLNKKGFRVLALAKKSDPPQAGICTAEDEREMTLLGYLAFLDPPKESAARAVAALQDYGIETKILTGDNEYVSRTVCRQVGLDCTSLLCGDEIAAMTDDDLAAAAARTQVFARLTPDQKVRVLTALRTAGHTVGFLGDGINDAGAMKAADVGISVDTAVDIAKESTHIILLEKDLTVLVKGIIAGRKTYANMIKYIKITASSNFGNMFSVLVSAALLPFLPMMSLHLLLLNLIYDLSCTALPWDNVDAEYLRRPRPWDASSVSRFMLWLGPTSSIFDITTYLVMYFIICPLCTSHGILYNELPQHFSGAALAAHQAAYAGMFQAGWFIESMWTQTLVIHMLRTAKLPFIHSHASFRLSFLTACGILGLTLIPYTHMGQAIGFLPLPAGFFAYLIPCVALYMGLTTGIKKIYLHRYGQLL